MNLEWPFFGIPNLGIYAFVKIKNRTIFIYILQLILYKIYLIHNGYNISDDDGNIVTMAWLIF
jgi:hypothetical protein